jgi:hypothetical protein
MGGREISAPVTVAIQPIAQSLAVDTRGMQVTSDLNSADADIENAIRHSMAKGQGGDARRLGMKTLHGQNQTRRPIGAEQEGARLAPTRLRRIGAKAAGGTFRSGAADSGAPDKTAQKEITQPSKPAGF